MKNITFLLVVFSLLACLPVGASTSGITVTNNCNQDFVFKKRRVELSATPKKLPLGVVVNCGKNSRNLSEIYTSTSGDPMRIPLDKSLFCNYVIKPLDFQNANACLVKKGDHVVLTMTGAGPSIGPTPLGCRCQVVNP